MTDPNDTAPNAVQNPEHQSISSTDAGDAGTVLGLVGAGTPAVAGEVETTGDLQLGAAPTADQPAPDQQQAASQDQAAAAVSTLEPTGTAPAELGATLTATPGSTDEPAGRVLPDEARATVATHLNAIEQIALYWGGETGTKIRNHVGFIREQLQ